VACRAIIKVRFEHIAADGARKVIGHDAKAAKGLLARHVLAGSGDAAKRIRTFTDLGWFLDAEEHLVALTLQRSLLPMVLPEVPGLAMSFRYIPASDQAEVGGDFYEALSWRDRVLVAIGDVQGHSLLAATVMGELRHALRAFVVEGHSPLAITGLVNEVLTRYHPGIIATLCLALLDPASGDLQIVNCGHMPALLVDGQDAVYVGEGGLLLGLPMHEPHVETISLPPGGTLLLMTDGLVEERDVFLDVNLEKLRVAAQEVSGADVEAFSNHLMSIFGPREDDVAEMRRAFDGQPVA
jgi:serine phosphatase RsbU (regulator of sigma subunit)